MSQTIPNNALVIVADGGKDFRTEEPTPRQTGEATFATKLVHRLDAMRQQGAYDHLVLAANPQTSRPTRDEIPKAVADSTVFSMAKGLTNHPAQDVADALG